MTLKVGLDYLPAVCHAPGIGRYARELVRALVRLEEPPELALFELGWGARRVGGEALGLDGARVRRLRGRIPRRAIELWCRLARSGADHLLGGVDLFHRVRPHHPPLAEAPEVLPIPELPPAGCAADDALGAAARRAAGVIVFCRDYGERVVERYGVDPGRVHRVPVGCDHWERDLAGPPPDRGSAPPELLVLGAVRADRTPLTVLAGFERLLAAGVRARLHFAGRAGDAGAALTAALARSTAARSVEWTRHPRERDLPRLVAGAAALVHLAEDEGTPVTPLEALRLGTAVVASPLPAFREALGEASADDVLWLSTPGNGPQSDAADGLAAALARTLQVTDVEGPRRSRRRLAAPFTWAANARKTLDVWQHIRTRTGGPG